MGYSKKSQKILDEQMFVYYTKIGLIFLYWVLTLSEQYNIIKIRIYIKFLRKSRWKKITIISIISAITLSILFFGCNENLPPKIDGLTQEQVKTIRQAYFEQECEKIDDIKRVIIKKYFGTYENNIALYIQDSNGMYASVNLEIIIGGISFGTYPNSMPRYWMFLSPEFSEVEGKKLVSLKNAYKNGYVSLENLKNIADIALDNS